MTTVPAAPSANGGAAPSTRAGGPATAVIHDIRYSRFEGQLRPRVFAVLALARSSALRALGVRRSAGAKVWPFLLVAGAWFPAGVAVAVPLFISAIASPLDVLSYYALLNIEAVVVLAYGATTVPSLLTRERRDRVLSLYFSTALSPVEYVVGKLLAALALLLLVVLGPLLLVWAGGVLVADAPLDWARDHAGDLPGVVGAALLVVVYQAVVGLAVGAMTSRRVFAIGAYVAVMLVPAAVGGVLFGVSNQDGFLVLDLLHVPVWLGGLALGEDVPAPAGLLWAVWAVLGAGGLALLALRYRSGHDA